MILKVYDSKPINIDAMHNSFNLKTGSVIPNLPMIESAGLADFNSMMDNIELAKGVKILYNGVVKREPKADNKVAKNCVINKRQYLETFYNRNLSPHRFEQISLNRKSIRPRNTNVASENTKPLGKVQTQDNIFEQIGFNASKEIKMERTANLSYFFTQESNTKETRLPVIKGKTNAVSKDKNRSTKELDFLLKVASGDHTFQKSLLHTRSSEPFVDTSRAVNRFKKQRKGNR